MRHIQRAVGLVLLLVLHSSARSQQPAAGPSQPAPTENRKSTRDDDVLLSRAAALYYSTKSAGLTGFDCVVHPDWQRFVETFESQNPVTAGDVPLLKGAAITLHARLNGRSTLEWIQPSISSKLVDQASEETIGDIHKAIEKTLMEFMQVWTPIVDGSMIAPSSAGVEVRHSASGFTLLSKQPDALVLEIFSNDLVLKEFKIITGGKMIDVAPSYDSVDGTFLVNRYVAHTGSATLSATDARETDVEIEYRTVDGFPIPSRLDADAVGTGTFNFKLDGCRANPTH